MEGFCRLWMEGKPRETRREVNRDGRLGAFLGNALLKALKCLSEKEGKVEDD